MNTFKEHKDNTTISKIRFVEMTEQEIIFRFQPEGISQNEIKLPIGFQLIASRYFKHPIPTEIEIEYAINTIEDELMSNKALICDEEKLVCHGKYILDFFTQNRLSKKVYSRQEIENLFSQYAYIVTGQPSSMSDVVLSRENVAVILLLREIMHHLGFEEVSLSVVD